MEKWARFEGDGMPICPTCQDRAAGANPQLGAHLLRYDPGEEPERCRDCGTPAPDSLSHNARR